MVSNKQMQHMIRNPRDLMKFQMTGKAPREQHSRTTPLRELIESINPNQWSKYGAITLSPKLGFNSTQTFHSIHALYRWLGGRQTVVGNKRLPYESRIIASVRSVSIETLKAHSQYK